MPLQKGMPGGRLTPRHAKSSFVLFSIAPYGLAALIRACDLALALFGIPGGGVQVLVPVD
jgi:hypothetical protein